MSTYDFSRVENIYYHYVDNIVKSRVENIYYIMYTTLFHNLIKEKLTELIEQIFIGEGSLYLACNDKTAFF